MRQGIQDDFPDSMLQEYGCYFFCLLEWSERITDEPVMDREIIPIFDYCLSKGWIEEDCFIINPVAILNHCIGRNVFRSVCKSGEMPKEGICVVYIKRPGHGHFVLEEDGERWDSMNPNRPAAALYSVDSYRLFS